MEDVILMNESQFQGTSGGKGRLMLTPMNIWVVYAVNFLLAGVVCLFLFVLQIQSSDTQMSP